jgi:hypothetical protein
MVPKTLWHITSTFNWESIQVRGIDPSYDKKEKGEVWLVAWHGIAWAILHTSFKKRIPPWQLIAIKVSARSVTLRHFNRSVWVAKCVMKPVSAMSAERALSQWEKQRAGMKYARKR